MIPGSYMVLRISGEVVAETTSVSVKMAAKKLETTSQDNGLNAGYEQGKVKLGLFGAFLLATDRANWTTLYGKVKDGLEVGVSLLVQGAEVFNGYGILKRLSLSGRDAKNLITGAYGIRYNYVATEEESTVITTEAGVTITTETGEKLIIE